MIYIFLFFYFVTNMIYGLDMKLNYGKENNDSFAVLNLRNNYPFNCESNFKVNGDVEKIVCRIDGIPQSGFNPTKSSMIAFSYQMENDPKDTTKKYMVLRPQRNRNSRIWFVSFCNRYGENRTALFR